MKLVNDCRHNIQDFRFTRIWHIAVIVNENGLEERWNHIGIDHFKIV